MKKVLPIFAFSLLALVVLSGISFGSLWNRDRAVITWTPPKIEEEQFPGTAKVLTAMFTSKKDLENIQLWIVPELEDFLTVVPDHFDRINKGEAKQIAIIASVPLDTSIGSYDGTIHLKAKKSNRTYPQTLKIILNIRKPSAEEIPIDEVSLAIEERIYEDPETGAVYVRDEVVIGFKESVSGARIKEIVSIINGSFLGSIPELGLYQVLVPVTEPSELEPIIQQLEDYPEIKIATYHWMDEMW